MSWLARLHVGLLSLPLLLGSLALADGDFECQQQDRPADPPPFNPPRIFDPSGNPVIPDGPVFTDPLCPPGTVPVSTLGDPYAVKGHPTITGDSLAQLGPDDDCDGVVYNGTCFYYGDARYYRQADGGGMTLTIERPVYVTSGLGGHSIAEISVQGGPGYKNIIEVGWNVSLEQYGDTDPHLFVYHWINGNETCYDKCNFVPVSKTYFPKMNLSGLIGHHSYSGWVYWLGNWWAWFDNQWLGYYPGTEWGQEYRQNGLTQWFGEVATKNGIPPQTQMGNGLFPSDPSAAVMETLCDVNSTDWVCWYRDLQTLNATVPSYYDIQRTGFGATRYGGPGM